MRLPNRKPGKYFLVAVVDCATPQNTMEYKKSKNLALTDLALLFEPLCGFEPQTYSLPASLSTSSSESRRAMELLPPGIIRNIGF